MILFFVFAKLSDLAVKKNKGMHKFRRSKCEGAHVHMGAETTGHNYYSHSQKYISPKIQTLTTYEGFYWRPDY